MEKLQYRDGCYVINGKSTFIIASDYQYYRDSKDNWEDRIIKLKGMNVNTVTFYIPWRHHLVIENERLTYDFTGKTKANRDLVSFMNFCTKHGLFMIAKPGPFIHSELNIGGLPDMVSPTFNESIEPVRSYDELPFKWMYDYSIMPAPFDKGFDALVKEWLGAVRSVISSYIAPKGNIIGIQLLDETIYCRSNNGPWAMGYEPSSMAFYHEILREKYGTIENYNKIHGTSKKLFEEINSIKLEMNVKNNNDIMDMIDWGEFQWRMRRDVYVRYIGYLGIDLPYITNYAPLCPPIGETLPDTGEVRKLEAGEAPPKYYKLAPEWWLSYNRIDSDVSCYNYGFISWLGVAAYDYDAFCQFVNTVRRSRGINMEENYGFATHYDPRSKFPIIPFFQSLLCIAAGASGYVAFVGVGGEHYGDDMDKVTTPPYPSDAPISHKGDLTPMYYSTQMLNQWLSAEGNGLLQSSMESEATWFLIPDYASVSSWVPDSSHWSYAGHSVPRSAYEAWESFASAMLNRNICYSMKEVECIKAEEFSKIKVGAVYSGFFMPKAAQETIIEYVKSGGKLIISGELPLLDSQMNPCTILKDFISAFNAGKEKSGEIFYESGNIFSSDKLVSYLDKAKIKPRVFCTDQIYAFVHECSAE